MIDAEHRELELLGHAPDEDELPAPETHRPRIRDASHNGFVGLVLEETWTQTKITCDNPMEVRR